MTTTTRTREAGAAGLVALAAMAMTAVLVAIVLGGVLDVAATAARARTAADAAALAAAGTSPLVAGIAPGDPRNRPAAAAQEVAQANGARLVETNLRDWPLRVGVRVTVQPRTPWARRIVGPSEAGSVAAVRPALMQPKAVGHRAALMQPKAVGHRAALMQPKAVGHPNSWAR